MLDNLDGRKGNLEGIETLSKLQGIKLGKLSYRQNSIWPKSSRTRRASTGSSVTKGRLAKMQALKETGDLST